MMMTERMPSFSECSRLVEDSDMSVSDAVSVLRSCHESQPDGVSALTAFVFGVVFGGYTVWYFAPVVRDRLDLDAPDRKAAEGDDTDE